MSQHEAALHFSFASLHFTSLGLPGITGVTLGWLTMAWLSMAMDLALA